MSRDLKDSKGPSAVLLQAEPLPGACRLRGFWPRSLTRLYSNSSMLLLNSSFLQTWGPVIHIRVTGEKLPPHLLLQNKQKQQTNKKNWKH